MPDATEIILDQIKEMRREMREDISRLHTPLNCPIQDEAKDHERRIEKLENNEQYRKGIIVALGAGAGLLVNLIMTYIPKVFR